MTEKIKFVKKEEISKLPKVSGVYFFRGKEGILYIGKAANIRERVKNHFSRPGFRENVFLARVNKIGYLKTDSEIEALILEANLIKKYQPKYNVVWKDDKNYFYVGVTRENFPRVFITHQPAKIFAKKKFRRASQKLKIENCKLKIEYVGPFVDGTILKLTLKILRKAFPFRTCKTLPTRPCLWYQLQRCPAPCLTKTKLAKELPRAILKMKKECQKNAKNIIRILEGKKKVALRNLVKEMKELAKKEDFETAAKIRNQIEALNKVFSHSKIFDWMSPDNTLSKQLGDPYPWRKTERELKKILKISGSISRIEAYDVSNIQGQEATGSMVAFIRGKPAKNFYRRFKVKISGKPNDAAMLKEILVRRFKHSEWGLPDLILIDGGIAQLNVGLKVKNQSTEAPSTQNVECFGARCSAEPINMGSGQRAKISSKAGDFFAKDEQIKNKIKVISLAKKENKLFIEGQKEPILLKSLPREIFNLILQLRDEAHRFAIAYHKKLRKVDLFAKS